MNTYFPFIPPHPNSLREKELVRCYWGFGKYQNTVFDSTLCLPNSMLFFPPPSFKEGLGVVKIGEIPK